MEQKKKIFLKKFLNVLSYVGIFVFFGFALVCAIFKFQGAKFTIFGSRYDVVLTNSMSEKNEKYKDFLEGHDDQFQAFDLAKSKPIEKAEDLRVYDVVIYNDRQVGTNMHRIVGIEEHGHDEVNYIGAVSNKLGEYDGIGLSNVESKIETSDLSFKTVEMTVYSELGSDKHYNFSIINTALDCEVSSVDAGNGKLVTYKVTKESAAPGKLTISHSNFFDYAKETIVSVKIDAAGGAIDAKKPDVTFDGGNAQAIYNVDYRFEIRGDKAADSDGYYSFNEIEAKVVSNSPKMGYFIRFLNSIWGGLMFILLGAIILTFDIISGHMDKKAKKAADASGESTAEQPVEQAPVAEENPVEETPKVDEKPIEEAKEETTQEPEKPNEDSKKQEELNSKMAEVKAAQEATQKAEEKAKEAEARARAAKEGIAKNKPEQPARVNGRFVSKNPAKSPAKPASNSSRWTKDNNPTVNKKRAAGGDK